MLEEVEWGNHTVLYFNTEYNISMFQILIKMSYSQSLCKEAINYRWDSSNPIFTFMSIRWLPSEWFLVYQLAGWFCCERIRMRPLIKCEGICNTNTTTIYTCQSTYSFALALSFPKWEEITKSPSMRQFYNILQHQNYIPDILWPCILLLPLLYKKLHITVLLY